jgi:hypothetical protein
MSRHFMPETLQLLRQQGYTVRPKADCGYQVQSPGGVNPEFRSFSIIEPKNGRDETVIRNRLRRAGVKFPNETSMRSERQMAPGGATKSSNILEATITVRPSTPPNPYAVAREKISRVVTLLGEIEQDINALEANNIKVAQLRELLKGF